MTQVAFSSSFKRAFKKRIEGRKELEQNSGGAWKSSLPTRTIPGCAPTNFPASCATNGASPLNTIPRRVFIPSE
jgi:hypothetical protein